MERLVYRVKGEASQCQHMDFLKWPLLLSIKMLRLLTRSFCVHAKTPTANKEQDQNFHTLQYKSGLEEQFLLKDMKFGRHLHVYAVKITRATESTTTLTFL